MKTVDRQSVHAFLNSLIAGQTPEEQIAMLKDIMVDEFCFNGIAEEHNISSLEVEIHEIMKRDVGKKIQCIKEVREKCGLGLAEAKAFVESLQPGHPTYGIKPDRLGTGLSKSVVTEHFLVQLGHRLNKLAKDYGKTEPF